MRSFFVMISYEKERKKVCSWTSQHYYRFFCSERSSEF